MERANAGRQKGPAGGAGREQRCQYEDDRLDRPLDEEAEQVLDAVELGIAAPDAGGLGRVSRRVTSRPVRSGRREQRAARDTDGATRGGASKQ